MAQDQEKMREDAHRALDYVIDEFARMKQCNKVIVEFLPIQGGLRASNINFSLCNFTGLKEVPGEFKV